LGEFFSGDRRGQIELAIVNQAGGHAPGVPANLNYSSCAHLMKFLECETDSPFVVQEIPAVLKWLPVQYRWRILVW
jgi:hypothetical protein